MRSAAIDIGSNTIRLLIAEPAATAGGLPWKTVYYTHRIARLAEGLHHSGNLSAAGMARAASVLAEFSGHLADYGVQPGCAAVMATAAVREAANGDTFRQHIKEETGLDIRVISGEQEAATALAGACAALEPAIGKDMLLLDIGGGSSEFIRTREGKPPDICSRQLGTVRLTDACLHSDPPAAADYGDMLRIAHGHLATVESGWRDRRPPGNLVGTAGSVTTLAAIELDLFPYRGDRVNNHRMSRDAFLALRDRLLSLSHRERLQIRTMEAGRSDLIIAGLAIIEAVMERWHYDEMVVVDAGVLEGIWLDTQGPLRLHA